jgi:hypothetical protein
MNVNKFFKPKLAIIGASVVAGVVTATLSIAPVIAAPVVVPAAKKPMTTITLQVKDCEGCQFNPASVRQAKRGTQPYLEWKSQPVTITNGKAQFLIPTRYTKGMSLEVSAPWEKGDYGAVPLATLSKAKGHCWAGTKKSAVSLNIVVVPTVEDGLGGDAIIPNAYLARLTAPKFIPGHQDLPYCVVPKK